MKPDFLLAREAYPSVMHPVNEAGSAAVMASGYGQAHHN